MQISRVWSDWRWEPSRLRRQIGWSCRVGVMGDCEVDLPKLATVEGNFAVSKTLVFNNTPAFSNLTTLSKKTTSLQTLVLASRYE